MSITEQLKTIKDAVAKIEREPVIIQEQRKPYRFVGLAHGGPRHPIKRAQLHAAADSVTAAQSYFFHNPCDETLRALNCEWIRAIRILHFTRRER